MADILDHRGLPIRTGDLRQPVATPQITRMRSPFSAQIGELTPEWLAMTLRQCEYGQYPERYLALAEAMEERDLHYRSVLGTRKMAVAGLEFMIEAASERRADVKTADLCREIFAADEFADVLIDLLDGLGKGFAVAEIEWDTGGAWRPARMLWKDPRWFGFPLDNPYWPHLIDGGNLLPLDPYKFIVHIPKLKSGLPLRGGLARAAAWGFMAKNFTVKDWLAFSEVYGMPLRLGLYPPGSNQTDIDVLMEAVAAIGSDFAGVIPDSMKLELKESGSKSASADIYLKLAEYLDKQMSKAVLGQTETADATPGRLGNAQEANAVREDILRFDARQVIVTLKRDLLTPLVRLNYGPDAALPTLRVAGLPDHEDKKLLIEAVKTFVPMGLKAEAGWMRDKFDIPDPGEDAELLTAPQASVPNPAPASPSSDNPPAQARHAAGCPHCAAHAQGDPAPANPAAQTVGAYTDQLEQAAADPLRAMLDAIRREAHAAESLEALRDRLLNLYGNLDADSLREVMTMGFALSALAGHYQVQQEGE